MISSGEKKEEYRELKAYWGRRLIRTYEYTDIWPDITANGMALKFKEYDEIHFKNGYGKNAPLLVVEWLGCDIGPAFPEWSDNWPGNVFRIKLGKIISQS